MKIFLERMVTERFAGAVDATIQCPEGSRGTAEESRSKVGLHAVAVEVGEVVDDREGRMGVLLCVFVAGQRSIGMSLKKDLLTTSARRGCISDTCSQRLGEIRIVENNTSQDEN